MSIGIVGQAQMSTGSTTGTTTGSGTGNSSSGQGATNTSPGFRDKSDLIGATAPPFDVEDVIRMHSVGVQDGVIVNALRTRYHPLILTEVDRKQLKEAGISDRVIVAMEDPYGIGIENVRENLKAAESIMPPIALTAKQAEKNDLHRPTLKQRADVDGSAYVGPSMQPDSKASATSTPTKEATLNISSASVTEVPPVPVMKIVAKPIGPGIYLRHGPDWERVDQEAVYWHHHGDKVKDIEGSVLRPASATQTYPGGSDFLIITTKETSVIQYQLLRLKTEVDKRTFKPAPSGLVYNNGGSDLIRFDPQQLGASSWLVSIHDVEPGEYGFLPPATSQVHSTTNLASTLYTFRVK